MKKLLTIILIIPLIFGSCGKGENDQNNIKDRIIGTWKLDGRTGTNERGYIDPVYGTDVYTSINTYTSDDYDGFEFTVFRYDNTFTDYEYWYGSDSSLNVVPRNSTYQINGNQLRFDSLWFATGTSDYSVTISSNNLNLDGSNSYDWVINDTLWFIRRDHTLDYIRSELPN